MLRLSCPAHWASTLVRDAFRPSGVDSARGRARWVRHADGQDELLFYAERQHADDAQADLEVVFRALPRDRAMGEALADPAPGSAVVWLSRDERWHGRVCPHGMPSLRMPCLDIDELWLPGPGMHLLPAARRSPDTTRIGPSRLPVGGSSSGWLLAATADRTQDGPFSRQAGTLGWPAVDVLRSRRYAVVGCGRNGHALALQLAAWEPREIVFIDADTLEPGNRDAGIAFLPSFSGSDGEPGAAAVPKIEAIAKLLQQQTPLTRIVTVDAVIESMRALRAAAACDVIVSATDNDAARLCCAAVAQLFHRVHLDVGSLVSRDPQGNVELGADVRLMLPGERDLCCMGGFAVESDLERFALRLDPGPTSRWQDRKAGALTSWSTLVAALGMRMLEDLAAGLLTQSRWVRMTQALTEHVPSVRELTAATDPYCPLCAIAGHGDQWLPRMRDLAAAALIRGRHSDGAHRSSVHSDAT